MPAKTLHRVCQAFWKLPKASQDALLWSLQSDRARKSKWTIEGLVVYLTKYSDLFFCNVQTDIFQISTVGQRLVSK